MAWSSRVVGILSVGVVVCTGAQGCSSADSRPVVVNGTPDGSADAGAIDSGSIDSATACTKDAEVTSYVGNCQWACITTACLTQFAACDSDCACNNAVLTALQCVVGGGSAFACFTAAAVDDAAGAFLSCSSASNAHCAATCSDAGDAGGVSD